MLTQGAVRLAVFAIAIKVAFLVLGVPIAGAGGDSAVYLGSIDNLIDHGVYSFDLDYRDGFAARMPGYFLPYGVLRLGLSREAAIAGTCFLQAVLDGLAVLGVGQLVFLADASVTAARIAAFSYLICTYVSTWNRLPLPESFSASASVLGLWMFAEGVRRRRRGLLYLSGALLAWVGFLKAYFIATLFVLCLVMAAAFAPKPISFSGWLSGVRRSSVLLIPFVLLDLGWIVRNKVVLDEWIPLQASFSGGYAYSEVLSLGAFVRATGGDMVSWRPGAEIRWFDEFAYQTRTVAPDYRTPKEPPPPHMLTARCDSRELVRLRVEYLRSQDSSLTTVQRSTAAKESVAGFETCKDDYQRTKPFDAYVLAPVRIFVRYAVHSGTYNLFEKVFSELSAPKKVFKLAQSALYLVVLGIGGIGAIWALARSTVSPIAAACALPVASQLFAFPFILRASEPRYLVMGFPFLVICGCWFVGTRGRRVVPEAERETL